MDLRNLDLCTDIALNGIGNIVEEVAITAPTRVIWTGGNCHQDSPRLGCQALNPFSSDEPWDWAQAFNLKLRQ